MTQCIALPHGLRRPEAVAELRRLLARAEGFVTAPRALAFGLPALDSHLPQGGLAFGALHEIVPEAEPDLPAAFGLVAALFARAPRGRLLLILPARGLAGRGMPHGHGLNGLGLDPARLILVRTADRMQALWAIEEGLRSAAPVAIAGAIETLDLKISQRLQFAAREAARPLLLLRTARAAQASAAATRWRIGAEKAARDRFGLFARARWRLNLERCRNGRPGEWTVEYDHVTHRFSLAAALADPALPCDAGAERRHAGRS